MKIETGYIKNMDCAMEVKMSKQQDVTIISTIISATRVMRK